MNHHTNMISIRDRLDLNQLVLNFFSCYYHHHLRVSGSQGPYGLMFETNREGEEERVEISHHT